MKHYTLSLFLILVSSLHAQESVSALDAPTKFDEGWIESTLSSFSLREKIGQLFIVAACSDENLAQDFAKKSSHRKMLHVESLIKDYAVGGVIFLGKSTIEKHIEATQALQQLSKTPLLVALDAEWGLSMRLKDGMVFPRNNVLGALDSAGDSADLVYEMAREVGRQLALIGVHINLAPVVDVNSNPNNPVIGTRSFGDNPELVAQKGIAFMRGLHDAGILSCAKHFPGHGDTFLDSHYELPKINHNRERLDCVELYPFVQLINSGIPAVMTAHLEVPALEPRSCIPASLSYSVVTNLLKKDLNFNGLVITDGLDMRGVTNHYEPGIIELEAFLAGNDILLCPLDVPKAVQLIEQAIHDGKITEQELDERVRKILNAKAWALNQNPSSLDPVYDHSFMDKLHTQQAYNLQDRLKPAI